MPPKDHRWQALSVTTLGAFLATINASTVLIALPAIFRGLRLNPLEPANVGYLLWMLVGYMVVTAVLVVTAGRLGDIYGRARMYTLGFGLFSVSGALCGLVPGHGGGAALAIIVMRCVQGLGGSLLMANSTAILTDVFPVHQRGLAVGVNQVFAVGGSFVGLVVGGLLAELSWRSVFWVVAPFGIAGTIWSARVLREHGQRHRVRLDLLGNATFGVGLIAVLVAITYGIQPYAGHDTGWRSPFVLASFLGGLGVLALFVLVERRVEQPMFDLDLFRLRAFASGNAAGLLWSISRGGLQFMLIIWLQGIWLPLHGYDFVDTPLWAAIYLVPLTVGFLAAGPVSGALSDRFGARWFSTGGMLLTAASFGLFLLLPVDFPYWALAVALVVNGVANGLFISPNTTAIMNAVPARQRGMASGMRYTFQNSGMVLSIGLFFTLLVVGLAGSLPHAMQTGLAAHGVPADAAARAAGAPPVGSLFAAFLGYNPISALLGPHGLAGLSASDASYLTGKQFFPRLLAGPFHDGLTVVFVTSAVMCLLAAAASWARGGRYVHHEPAYSPEAPAELVAD